ncbi:MAG: hypothetical protein ACRES9_07595 [Gammaproteobacteria bacterium]
MQRLLKGVIFLVFALALATPAVAAQLPAMPGVPADVQAVMQKAANGQQLTDKDQKTLQAYEKSLQQNYEKMVKTGQIDQSLLKSSGGGGNGADSGGISGGDAAGGNPASGEVSVGSGNEESPCIKPGHALGFGATPSRDAYVSMAARVFKSYGAKLSSTERDAMNKALTQAPVATAGSDVAPMLMVLGETASAVYAAAYSAYKAPTDVLSANNLGAMLKGAQDYADAAIALQYARSLAPKSPLIAANLGWLAMNQGDSAAAGPYFKAAVGEAPQMAIALSGQGLIEACAGHAAKALPLFRASLAAGFSELAMDGVEISEQALDRAKPGAESDPGSPDVYGPKSSHVPEWPRPPLAPDAKTMADYMRVSSGSNYSEFVQYTNAIAKQGLQAIVAAQTRGDIGSHTRFDGQKIVFQRGYDKEDFVLSDLRTILKAELQKPMDDEDKDKQAFLNEDGCFTCSGDGPPLPDSCSNQTRVAAVYRKYYPRFNDEWNRLQQAIADLYGFSEPWLARIHDPAAARAEKAALDSFVLFYVENFDGSLYFVSAEANGAWESHPYQSCSDPSPERPPLQKVKPYKIDPTKCRMEPMSMPTPFVSGSGDCDQISISIGIEGFGGSVQYKFPPDFVFKNGVYVSNTGADGEWTVFGGINLSTPSEIPISASVKAGSFVSFQGGKLTDIGLQDEATVGLNVAGLNLSAGASTRVGVASGVNVTPTASADGDWGSLPNH